MALTNWNDILNKPKGIDEVPEITVTVEQLSASVLSISEDVGEIAEDVQEIALEISQLSASTLPYSETQSTKEKIDEIGTTIIENNNNDVSNVTNFQVAESITLTKGTWIVKGSLRITSSTNKRVGAAIVEGTETAFSAGTYNAVLSAATQNTANRVEVNAILKVTDDTMEYKLICYSDDTYEYGSRIITAIKIA